MKRGLLAVVFVVGIVSGVATGWVLGSRRADSDIKVVALGHQLETVALCAGALNSLVSDDSDTVKRVLEYWMGSSLVEADRLMSSGVAIGQATPNLRDGVHRASMYAERDDVSPELRQQVAEVLERLDEAVSRDAS